MAHISAVVPVYHEELLMDELARRLCSALGSIHEDFEILFVDDGSRDGTWEAITRAAEKEPRIRGLRFSRNFGQHYAITAGLDECDGDWVVVMDGDLQDRPEVIPDLYAKAREGYDVVFVARQNRPETIGYRITQRMFFWVFKTLAATDYDPEYGNFSIVSRRVIDQFRSMRETLRFYGGIVHWLGFERTSIPAQHGERVAGATRYTLARRFQLAVSMILAHSERPLWFSIALGLIMGAFSVGFGTYVLLRAMFSNFAVQGWASLMVAVFFTGGAILTTLGIIGVYIGKLFNELKGRPLYVVADRVGPETRYGQRRASGA
jgi:glycosyltransferase involved in cell wall biosynthesis